MTMSAMEEDTTLLHDQSMDEVYRIDEVLRQSIDTDASPSPTHRHDGRHRRSIGSINESDIEQSELSSDEDGSHVLSPFLHSQFDEHNRESDDSTSTDGPPEIPGSPLQGLSPSRSSPRSIPSFHSPKDKLTAAQVDELITEAADEYETREEEDPRAMELCSSSSSEEDDLNMIQRDFIKHRSSICKDRRPQTAAKELEKYRNAVPSDFFKKRENSPDSATQQQPSSPEVLVVDSIPPDSPKEVVEDVKVLQDDRLQQIFKYIDDFEPTTFDLECKFKPFLPTWIPAIGDPFDAINIPRPDNMDDGIGRSVLREPTLGSNRSEIELLLQAQSKQRSSRNRSAVPVRSIDDASHRPQAIDEWMQSVERVRKMTPFPQVVYDKPMPAVDSLMGYWSEAFEDGLDESVLQLCANVTTLDVDLKQLVQIVCGILDIPIYNKGYLQSLHLLFSMYFEMEFEEVQNNQHCTE